MNPTTCDPVILTTVVYKLRPSKAQLRLLEEPLETRRWRSNQALAARKTAWQERRESRSCADQCRWLTTLTPDHPTLATVHSHVL
ncbi:MAG: hypothetical protein KatS3mg057_2140 [Herpetosiphonaceae bacterium]|nr:MAG: hypothetical protein KatS3mg057_2140 [Herpetosiphonaceae bacterium]